MNQKLFSFKVHEDDYSNVPFIYPNDTLYYEPVEKDLPQELDNYFAIVNDNYPQIKQVKRILGSSDYALYEITYAGSILDELTTKENTYIMPKSILKKSGLIVGVVKEIKRDIYDPVYLELHKYYTKSSKEKQWNTFTNIIKAF